jgi:hypothetical protein
LSRPGSPDRDYPGMIHETTRPGFGLGTGGGGHLPLSDPMERYVCRC